MYVYMFASTTKRLFSMQVAQELKYISLGSLNYENSVFYHYYFAHNGTHFVEASLVNSNSSSSDTNTSTTAQLPPQHDTCAILLPLYASCNDKAFFLSVKYLFDALVGKDNVIFKGEA